MKSFKHINSDSLGAAVQMIESNKGKSRVIAGGTDVLGILKDKVHAAYPELLVNIKTIGELDYIKEDAEGLKIGATTKLHAMERDDIIREKYAALAQAAHSVASPQIRSMATIGGNICQEPRCWYYRNPDNTFDCTRKGGKYCNAFTGENRYHSIFGSVRVDNPPCSSNCPGTVNIPAYMSRFREGDLADAATILLRNNPIPAITGRVCPHFCEEDCNRGDYDESVSIRAIERFIGDYILDNADDIIKPPAKSNGKSVGIIGAGPAGLAAAYYLRMAGNQVVVFDQKEEAGGLLMYGIPSYRLDKNIVRRTVAILVKIGVEFTLNTQVGQDISLEALKKDYDAVFVAGGAWAQPSIGLEGEEFTRSGLELLNNVNSGAMEKPGKKVVVIGGGNVAVDVGVTALRLGADEVTLVCLECREEMPALKWEVEQAVEEGVKLLPSWGPAKVLLAEGKVTGIELVRCTSVFDDQCRFSPSFDHEIVERIEADQIFLAVGQKADLSFIDDGSSLTMERGLICTEEKSQKTNLDGLFAGGDAVSGPATVIQAISSGRRAAEAINQSLVMAAPETSEVCFGDDRGFLRFDGSCLQKSDRVQQAQLPVSERKIDEEDVQGLSQDDVSAEAKRCFNCGCVAVSPSDLAPALIALDAQVVTTKRTIGAEEFFRVGPRKTTVLDENELVTEIRIPRPEAGSTSAYSKFRIRKTIDFPILSIASVFNMKSKEIVEARMVLGAAAPVPYRLKEVETFLKGKEVSEKAAEEAATVAVRAVVPLANNEFKVPVVKALVKRAIYAVLDGIDQGA